MRGLNLSLTAKIFLLILPLTLVPLLVTGVPAYIYIRQTVLLIGYLTNREAVVDVSRSLTEMHASLEAAAAELADRTEIGCLRGPVSPARPGPPALEILENTLSSHPIVSAVAVLNREGAATLLVERGPSATRPARSGVNVPALPDGPAVRDRPSPTSRARLVATVETRCGDVRTGSVRTAARPDAVDALVREVADRAATPLFLLDERGRVLAPFGAVSEAAPRAARQGLFREEPTGLEGVSEVDDGILARLDVGGRVGDTSSTTWFVFSGGQDQATRERFNALARGAALVVGLSVIFSLTGAGLIAATIVRPLTALARASDRIARGDFEVRVPNDRGDEIGELTSAFNAMAGSLATSRQELLRAEGFAALGRLASVVAHEVRNPLNAIRGCADYLSLKRQGDDLVTKHTDMIRAEIDSLNGFVGEFLGFSRLPAPKVAPAHVGRLVETRIRLHGPEAEAQGVRLDVEIAAGDLDALLDRHQIGVVLQNLTTNALDAMPRGGALRVAVARSGPDILVSIADTGAGMSPEIARQVFTPFFTTKDSGNGIGLATAKRIVEAHGGTLEFTTRPGEGTTFNCRLPALRGHGEAAEGRPAAAVAR